VNLAINPTTEFNSKWTYRGVNFIKQQLPCHGTAEVGRNLLDHLLQGLLRQGQLEEAARMSPAGLISPQRLHNTSGQPGPASDRPHCTNVSHERGCSPFIKKELFGVQITGYWFS